MPVGRAPAERRGKLCGIQPRACRPPRRRRIFGGGDRPHVRRRTTEPGARREDVPGEGISHLEILGEDILLTDALATNGTEILGKAYAEKHGCLDRLVKIYDFGTRLFMHIHQKAEALAGTGKNPKDEAYHFLDAPMGPHPESFFGVQRFLVENNLQYDYFLPFLQAWEGGEEEILKYSSAYVNVPGEGFHLPPGILHAPGSALTIELQEDSDVSAMF